MKLFACFVIIIANICKASLDSFPPASVNNILFEDTTRNFEKSCNRPCKFNVKPKRCYYHFKIAPTVQGDGKPVIAINGMTPGPPINVCASDIIVVEVQNNIPGQDVAIHWHGMDQKGTPYMDGVPMVTQCPISYGSTYKYAFIASSPGTFFYHADSVSHQSDGVYGSLTVNQPQPLEPHSNLYDYDRSTEHTVLLAATFPGLQTANLEGMGRPTSLLINGEKDSSKLYMMPGFAYRLRLVNAIAIECPVVLAVDRHHITIIASDGRPVKPVSTRKVKLYPGERMDVVVRMASADGGYWLRARGGGACAGLAADSMILTAGYNYTALLQDHVKRQNTDGETEPVIGQMLESIHEFSISPVVRPVYLGVDRHVGQYRDQDNDFRYISDALPRKPFFPATFALQDNGVVQINGKNFLYPSAPILLTPQHAAPAPRCAIGAESEVQDPQCLQVLDASLGDVIEIALVNEGFGSNDSYTFHMHGYSMHIVATGRRAENTPISKEEFLALDKQGKIQRNLQYPVVKDTVTVPSQGYVIFRIRVDYGGAWLLESRSSELPTAILMNVPQAIPKPVRDSLPKCGSFKPPDVLLN